jgi:two-component system, chemotaxis family, chemotaxis protein CheY
MPKTILVVDDSMIARQQVIDATSDLGFELVEAANGAEGLSKFQTTPDVLLVISDLNMPVMDGIEMSAAIRALPTGQTVPIVLVTTESSAGQVERSKAAGITGWLVKPFNPNHLKAAVKKATGL